MATMNLELAQKRALGIVKYQNFKTKVAVEKIGDINETTFACGVTYVKRGVLHKRTITKILKDEIDKCIANHVQPLTPKEDERRQFSKAERRKPSRIGVNAEPPVARLEILQNPITETFDYGVKVDNNIRILGSENDAKSFIEGVKFVNPSYDAKLVEIKFKEL